MTDTTHVEPVKYMGRIYETETITITNSLAKTEAIDKSKHAGLAMNMPASLNASTVTVYGSDSESGTYNRVYEIDVRTAPTVIGAITVAADRYIPLPDELYKVPYVKLVSNHATQDNIIVVKVS